MRLFISSTKTDKNPSSRLGLIVVALAAFGLLAAACGGSAELEADAGADFQVEIGETPTFDGCESSGDIDNYEWVITDAPEAVADDVDKALRDTMDDCTFTVESAMLAEEAGEWTIELTVTDSDGAESSDEVTVTVG